MEVSEQTDLHLNHFFDFQNFLGLFSYKLQVEKVEAKGHDYVNLSSTQVNSGRTCTGVLSAVVEVDHLEDDHVGNEQDTVSSYKEQ